MASLVVSFAAIVISAILTDSVATVGLAAATSIFLILTILVAGRRLSHADLNALRPFQPRLPLYTDAGGPPLPPA
jgi:hypothetical protein